jgi:cell pole-organizing protein PopZ
MPARETPVRETFVRPVPAQTPRDMAARDAAPFHGTPNGRVTFVGREPVNGSATSTRSDFAAATPLRPRPEAPVLPVASATTRPVPPARSLGPAPLPPVSSGARPATESPYSYGSTVPGFRSAAAAPSYAPAGRVPATDPFAPRPRSASGLASARALPVEKPEQAPVAEIAPRPVAIPPVAPTPVAPSAGLKPVASRPRAGDELDAPLASVLLDLALVEQAVQAELAAFEPMAKAQIAPPVAEAPATSNATSAVTEPAPAAETANMQLQATKEQDNGEPVVPETANAAATEPESAAATAEPAKPAKPEEPEAASAKPAPAMPRAFVPSFRSEPRPPQPENRFTIGRTTTAGDAAASSEVPRERLVSGPTNSAVSSAFGSLHRSVAPSARSVDDLVTEALRPMLKAWLDENLPSLVERLVRAEIERVARQGQ